MARLKALLRGGADPRLRSAFGETPLEICTLADWWRGALPEDKALTKVLREALQPWHRKRHGLFPRSFTPRVVTVLLLQQRLERLAVEYEQASEQHMIRRRRRRRAKVVLVWLSKEQWLEVVPFLRARSAGWHDHPGWQL